MTEKRWDLREIARSALNEMPPRDRVPFLAELLCEVDGPEALALLARARNAISLHMTSLIDGQMGEDDVAVEVQAEPDGSWRPARLIDGRLHWSPGPVGPTEAGYFAAISDACVRANREVPAAIAAVLAEASPQSSVAETRRASQGHPGGGQDGGAAMPRFRPPRSAQQGES